MRPGRHCRGCAGTFAVGREGRTGEVAGLGHLYPSIHSDGCLCSSEDTLKFTEFHSMGATYAVYLKAVNATSAQSKEGWVSCGSFMFPYKALRLSEQTSLVMPEREPQRFVSAVTVYTQSGEVVEDTIEVNRPLKIFDGTFIN